MSDLSPDTGTPRWVKVFGIIAIVLVLLVGGLLIFGGGNHGPGRHTPSGDVGSLASLSGLTEARMPTEGCHG